MRIPLSFLHNAQRRVLAQRYVLGGLLLLLGTACDRPPRPQLVRSIDQEQRATLADAEMAAGAAAASSRTAEPATPFEPWENWEAHFIQGEHVGFSHLRAERVDGSGAARVRYTLKDQITLRRGATLTTQLLTQESIERLDGTLDSFQARLQNGADVTTYEGKRQADRLLITTRSGGTETTREIPWQADFRGLAAIPQSLRRAPMRAGQSRQIHALLSMQYQIGTYQLQAVGPAAVPLLSGKSETLLEIKNRLQLSPEMAIDSVLWVDDQGRILKSLMPKLDLVSYRTDAQTATAEVTPTKDLLAATAIPVDRVIERPEQVQLARYRISAGPGTAAGTLPVEIPTAPGQTVRPGETAGQQEVTVRAGVDGRDALPPPTETDRRPSVMVDSSDRGVQELVGKLVPRPPADRYSEALRLAEAVQGYVERKDYSRGFSSASQVVIDASGDCTEHSVLLAAMLRARQIPARVAAGLVYMPTADGPVMAFHMWTLAYIDGQGWLPLDATLDQIPAAANRITLLTTDLASGEEFVDLLPILNAIGQLRVEILEVTLDRG